MIYNKVIRTMDVVISSKFPNVSLSDKGGQWEAIHMATSALQRPGVIKPPARVCESSSRSSSSPRVDWVKVRYAELNLTSMVDMLTILVVFLLQTFSASGELLTVSKNITLPEAVNFRDLEQAPIIAVSRDSVTLNGDPKADSQELSRENTVDWKIPQLHDDLVVLKNNFKLLHPNPEGLEGHRDRSG